MARRGPSPLPRHLRAHHLRRMMREQFHQILRTPVRLQQRGRGQGPVSPPASPSGLHGRRGGRRRANNAAARRASRASSSSGESSLAARRGLPVAPDSCIAPDRILVSSPRHCPTHGWTARVRLEQGGRPQIMLGRMMMYHQELGWITYTHIDVNFDGSPHQFVLESPEHSHVASPVYSPQYTPAVEPRMPEHLLRGTIAARRGAPPLYIDIGGSSSGDDMVMSPLPAPEIPPLPPLQAATLAAMEYAPPPPPSTLAAPAAVETELVAPPPPPAAWFPDRPTAAAAANRRPSLRRPNFIPTGHIPAGPSAGEARRPSPLGEGEA
ncbi:unnamed protein product [Urochloa humidicola]